MAGPIQLSVDLNEIVKKLVKTAEEVRDFSRDSSDTVTRLRRELGKTEFYAVIRVVFPYY